MKKLQNIFQTGAIITNSARGDMIDDEAMISALNKKNLRFRFRCL